VEVVDSQSQVEQAVHQRELLMSQTSPVSVLLLVTQVAVQIILVVGAVVTLVPSVVSVVRQADMVLTVGNSMQGVLEAMGLEER
tara:strand:- start:254 stop:505 length:252 start_codon:yes stop_codon:yes gene_type:complete